MEKPNINRKTFEEVLDEHGYLIYSNVGCSMRPLIREGRDLMVIESVRTRPPKIYDAVLFRRPGVSGRGEYVLHRILRINPDGTYWIAGDNTVSGETVRPENVLGVLIEVKRGFHKKGDSKSIKADDPLYRAYVKCWCKPYRARFALTRGRNRGRALAARTYRFVRRRLSRGRS